MTPDVLKQILAAEPEQRSDKLELTVKLYLTGLAISEAVFGKSIEELLNGAAETGEAMRLIRYAKECCPGFYEEALEAALITQRAAREEQG
jgi:hypothetical protein